MKSQKSIFGLFVIGTLLFVAGCKEAPYIQAPGDPSHNQDSVYIAPDPLPDPDPEGVDIPEGTINVNEALKICSALASGTVTPETFHIKGWITRLGDKNADGIENYGNATFYMAATKNGATKEFYAYQVMGKDGKRLTHLDQVKEGDFVVIEGKMTNYNGTCETQGQGAAHIYSSSNAIFDPQNVEPTPDPAGVEIPAGTLTVSEANALCPNNGDNTTEKYYVKGWVVKLDSKHASGMSQYGNATFYIASNVDGIGDQFEAYQVYGKNGMKFTADQADAVQIGDFVIIYGPLTNYKGTVETKGQGAGYVYYSTNPKW